VILNGPVHVGTTVKDVAIADLTLLRIFFDGRVDGATAITPMGKVEILDAYTLYKNVEEAKSSAHEFFTRPIHLKHIWEGLSSRKVPIIGMKDGKPVNEADYLLKEVKIDFDAVQKKYLV
jgi:hypothetical protein